MGSLQCVLLSFHCILCFDRVPVTACGCSLGTNVFGIWKKLQLHYTKPVGPTMSNVNVFGTRQA